MSQIAPLHQHFTPQTLTELGVAGISLIASVSYAGTEFKKTGKGAFFGKIGRKLPVVKSLTPVKETMVQMDLDLSCVVLDGTGKATDTVWYGKLRDDSESIIHVGDSLAGSVDFEESLHHQEEIHIRLSDLPQTACELVFFVSSFYHHELCLAKKGVLCLNDNENTLIHKYPTANIAKETNTVLAWHIIRQGDDFLIKAPMSSVDIKNNEPKAFCEAIRQFAENMHKTD